MTVDNLGGMSAPRPPASETRIPIIKFGRHVELGIKINVKLDENDPVFVKERNKIIGYYRNLILDAVKKDIIEN